ncbi:MAG: hypothetical protein FJ149_09445 [Euryarchaeota archaeon]|nr:hypothetical protein [Euryarchaeota archaeon]
MRWRVFTLTLLLVCPALALGIPAGNPGAQAHQSFIADGTGKLTLQLDLPEPTWERVDGYILLGLEGCPGYVRVAGAPLVPFWGRMLPFPVGTRVLGVGLENARYEEHLIGERVLPAPEPVPLVAGATAEPLEGPSYSTDRLYPETETDFTVTTGMGESGGVEAHLFLKVFPVRYNPVSGQVRELRSATVTVSYIAAPQPHAPPADAASELLILTPPEFESEMGRYKEHKEGLGFTVRMVNLTSVYDSSIFNVSAGRDGPEKIKLFIKGALENWSVRYVVLAGDVEKFPVRRACFLDYYESYNLPTDLYYGDIYKAGTRTFCDWDKDRDNLFAECYPSTNPDAIDIDPDVTVGRLPAGTLAELSGLINKTISYRENVTGSDWFQNVTLVGTDTFGPSRGEASGVAEGEYACDVALSYLNSSGGFNATRFYELNRTFSISGIRECLNRGGGFAVFANHGSTDGVCYPDSGGGPGLSGGTASALTNGPRYPLSVLDACSTHAIDSNDCLGEDLVLNPRGGSIASMGATRVAYGGWGTWHIRGNSGYMNVHLAEMFSKGTIMPGVMLDRTKQSYMANVGIWDYADMKTMVQYIQLGDPVAFIGGPGVEASTDAAERWVDPGGMVQYEIALRNGALHSDTVQLSISGSRWAAGLNTSVVVLPSNSSATVTLRVSADPLADAYESSTLTLDVTPRSTQIPIRLELTTRVNCVRRVSFSVNETRFSAFPGQEVSVGYSVGNEGNIRESVSLSLAGMDPAWPLFRNEGPYDVARRTTLEGNLSVAIPERTVAGVYGFELRSETESGITGNVPFQVLVHRTYGFSASVANATTIAGRRGAAFDVTVTNLGNHEDGCELRLSGLPDGWGGTTSFPLQMGAFEERPQDIVLVPDGCALAGDYQLTMELFSPAGRLESHFLTVTVGRHSDLRLMCPEPSRSVDEGSDVDFLVSVGGYSNFPEEADISVGRLPEGWGWFPAPGLPVVEPFSSAGAAVVVQVPSPCPAGTYTIDLVASTAGWRAETSVKVEVRRHRAFSARLDETQAALPHGGERAFTVSLENTGNCPDTYLLSADGALPVDIRENLQSLEGGSSRDLSLVLSVPPNAPSGVHELSVRVSSVADPTIVRQLALRVRVEGLSDVDVRIERRSGASPGTTGVFWLTAENRGSDEETVTLHAPGLSAWNLELPGLSVPAGTTVRAPVFYTVPDGIDGGSYELSLVADSGGRPRHLVHEVDVPAQDIAAAPGGASRTGPSPLLPLAAGVIVLAVVSVGTLTWRARRKRGPTAVIAPAAAAGPAPPPQ